MTDHSFDEWSVEEQAQLAEIGRHRSPRASLKTRTIDALHEQGLVGAEVSSSRMPRRLVLGLAAAATLVFTAGVLTGYGVAAKRRDDARRDSVGKTTVSTEVARVDSLPLQNAGGRHVIWF